MLIEVDFAGEVPIYTQVRDQIVIGIAAGLLKPGEALPSVRRLAADIGINVHTVNKAYSLLREEGFLLMDRRSGAEIAPLMTEDPSFDELLSNKLIPVVAEAICRRMDIEDFCMAVRKTYSFIKRGGK